MEQPIALDYGRRRRRLSRRTVAIVAAGVAIAIAVPLAVRAARPYLAQRARVRAQDRVMTTQWPADRVMYGEGANVPQARSADEMVIADSYDPGGRGQVVASRVLGEIFTNPAAVFTHRRTSSNGASRVVLVQSHRVGESPDGRRIVSAYFGHTYRPLTGTPGSALSAQVSGPMPCVVLRPTQRWTAFAGQADPHDAARFTIGYAIDDARGTIEGRLQDDGSIAWARLDGPGEWLPLDEWIKRWNR